MVRATLVGADGFSGMGGDVDGVGTFWRGDLAAGVGSPRGGTAAQWVSVPWTRSSLQKTFQLVTQSFASAARVDQGQVHRLRRSHVEALACRCDRYHTWVEIASRRSHVEALACSCENQLQSSQLLLGT